MSINSRLKILKEAWPKLSEVTVVGRQSTDAETSQYESLFWAATAMTRLIERRPELALQVISDIMHATNDTGTLEHLAAGPLEDLLSENRSGITELVENHAAADPKFRTLLRQVWRNRMDDETWRKVCAARGS